MSAHQEGASRGAPVDSVVALHSKRRTCTLSVAMKKSPLVAR